MPLLGLLIRIERAKRQELLQSLRTLVVGAHVAPCRVLVLQDLDDATRICWLAEWTRGEDLEAFARSGVFAALRGAAHVLGDLEAVRVFDDRPEPASPGSRGTTREPT